MWVLFDFFFFFFFVQGCLSSVKWVKLVYLANDKVFCKRFEPVAFGFRVQFGGCCVICEILNNRRFLASCENTSQNIHTVAMSVFDDTLTESWMSA